MTKIDTTEIRKDLNALDSSCFGEESKLPVAKMLVDADVAIVLNKAKILCDAYDKAIKEIEYLLKIARKAEEMAKFYADQNIIDINYINDRGSLVNYWKKNGDKAREFLSFLEKGE